MTDLDAIVDEEVGLAITEPASSDAVTLTHVVTRPFIGAGLIRHIGEIVDASTWRMADILVGNRRLRTFNREDPEPVTDGQGRFFIDDDSLLAYIEAEIAAAVDPDLDDDSDDSDDEVDITIYSEET